MAPTPNTHHHHHDANPQGIGRAVHSHDHASDHPHFPSPQEARKRPFLLAIALNLGFVVVEAAFGFRANSLSLVADAGHNFGDVIGLVLAGLALVLAQRTPSAEFTYGLRASTILAALGNAMLLLVVTGGIAWASVERLRAPAGVKDLTVIVIATLGLLINASSAFLFASHRHSDLNARAAFLHMVADASVALGVIVAALAMRYTGWNWLDPLVSLAIALIILLSTWDLLNQSLRLAMQAVPASIDAKAVRDFLSDQEGVREVHDLHIWAMSTTETAMTAHLVVPGGHPGDHFLDNLTRQLDTRFRLGHVTLQVETGAHGKICSHACETLVATS